MPELPNLNRMKSQNLKKSIPLHTGSDKKAMSLPGTEESSGPQIEPSKHGLKSDETLANSEARYRRLFEAAKDGILILDARTGVITDVNPYLAKLLEK